MNWGKRLLVLGREEDVCILRTHVYVCVYKSGVFFQRTCVQVRNFGREGSTLREGVSTVMANLFSDPRAFDGNFSLNP